MVERLIEGDELTEMSAAARRRIDIDFRLAHLKVAEWEPAPCPPREEYQ